MRTISQESPIPGGQRSFALSWLQRPLLPRLTLGAIVVLALVLRCANMSAIGYVNHYYSAGIVSMLQSWHNFFFVAAEPGAAVSIDKPPVGLWLQAISAAVFGVNGFGVLLPQILAGIGSILLLYRIIQPRFGTAAGLLATLVMAITPVVVATDRNNTIDSTLIFTLLLAAWAFISATERSKLRYLLLGAALVGIAFNIKMLQAFLPLPAFYGLYLLGAKVGIWRKLGHLALATLLMLAISLSWAVTVDLTPATQRPFIGSSGDNSMLSLITGYNGVMRLFGRGQGGLFSGGGQGRPNNMSDSNSSRPQNNAAQGGGPGGGPPSGNVGGPPQANGAGMQGNGPPSGNVGGPPQANGAGMQGNSGRTGGFSGSGTTGMSQIGEAGWLRLFTPPLSKEVSWLLSFSLGGLGLLIASTRPRWTITREHQAAILWGGWLLTGAIFFSIAGFFHEYYLSMLAAPLAALVGIGSAQLWRLRANRPWLALILLLLFGGITLALQLKTAQSFVGDAWWLLPSLGLFVVGAIVSFQATLRTWRRLTLAGWATIGLALLITPGIWAGLTTLNPSSNQSLPSAYSGEPSAPANNGAIQVNSELIDYLQANTQGVRYLMAVPSSMQGSDYVLATGRPVLYLGGFMGQDQVLSTEQLAQLVKDGELRYIYSNAGERSGRGGPSSGGQSGTSSWITANCTVVDGFATQTRNMGAPGGTEAASDTSTAKSSQGDMGGFQIQLYDCAEQ